jgi:hypothetical protein
MSRGVRLVSAAHLVGAALALLSAASPALASGPLGANGTPIHTSAYGVDLTATPVLAGTRVTGLAGAYVAIAEGTDGDIQNPVAPAVRVPYSVDHFDYDLGLGLTVPATLTSTDFFNTGRGRTELGNPKQQGFVFITPTINVQWGGFGLGATLELANYSILRGATASSANAVNDELSALFIAGDIQAAHTFLDRKLVLGAGVRIVGLNVTNPGASSGDRDLFTTSGAGLELGALWMPTEKPYRLGAAFRSAISTQPDASSHVAANTTGDRVVGDPNDAVNAFWLPNRIEQPWELDVGLAVQMGPRPLNPKWLDPNDENAPVEREIEERERRRAAVRAGTNPTSRDDAVRRTELDAEGEADDRLRDETRRATRKWLKERANGLPRGYVLVSMSLLITGPVNEAVGVESFLQRVVNRSGQIVDYSPRLGIETEPVPHWLKVRAGTYGEPSRFQTAANRLHGTFGFDAKLFSWPVFGLYDENTEWRIGASLDAATRYLGWGVSIGNWH